MGNRLLAMLCVPADRPAKTAFPNRTHSASLSIMALVTGPSLSIRCRRPFDRFNACQRENFVGSLNAHRAVVPPAVFACEEIWVGTLFRHALESSRVPIIIEACHRLSTCRIRGGRRSQWEAQNFRQCAVRSPWWDYLQGSCFQLVAANICIVSPVTEEGLRIEQRTCGNAFERTGQIGT
ncbi:hypothetical protein BKA93DRAFT_420496 [Sparassis latifolia]